MATLLRSFFGYTENLEAPPPEKVILPEEFDVVEKPITDAVEDTLPMFNPDNMCDYAFSLIIGAKCTGKTTLLEHLTKDKKGHFFINTPPKTEDEEPYKSHHVKELPDMISRGEDEFYVFDDLLWDRSIANSEEVQQVFFNMKNMKNAQPNTRLYVSAQTTSILTPRIRENADYVFLAHQSSYVSAQLAWASWMPFLIPISEFLDKLGGIATKQNYKFLVIDVHQRKLYWYKAPAPNDFIAEPKP